MKPLRMKNDAPTLREEVAAALLDAYGTTNDTTAFDLADAALACLGLDDITEAVARGGEALAIYAGQRDHAVLYEARASVVLAAVLNAAVVTEPRTAALTPPGEQSG